MRHLRFLPLALICGEHGFALLAPYLAVCVVIDGLIRWRRARPAATRPATLPELIGRPALG